MASLKHDFIVASISRKIRNLGFEITYIDGKQVNISLEKLSIPPKIIMHKPDIIGENKKGNYCIGEAKTKNDLKSKRSKQQLIDFSEFVNFYEGNHLIIGIPLSAENELHNLLKRLKIKLDSLIILRIPDELLN
jgi:hypothetical protein